MQPLLNLTFFETGSPSLTEAEQSLPVLCSVGPVAQSLIADLFPSTMRGEHFGWLQLFLCAGKLPSAQPWIRFLPLKPHCAYIYVCIYQSCCVLYRLYFGSYDGWVDGRSLGHGRHEGRCSMQPQSSTFRTVESCTTKMRMRTPFCRDGGWHFF